MAEIKRTIHLSLSGTTSYTGKAELIIPRNNTVTCSTLEVEGAADSLQNVALIQDVEYWSLGYTSIVVSAGSGTLVVYEKA